MTNDIERPVNKKLTDLDFRKTLLVERVSESQSVRNSNISLSEDKNTEKNGLSYPSLMPLSISEGGSCLNQNNHLSCNRNFDCIKNCPSFASEGWS